ncbi:NADP-dependent oxidoreductase [Planococcus salinus]|uniref:NADP-dependent oxidoreductase n=1 Tax=Planococcus salinus TaxID=1848460 RepID=A0A3M8P6A7_9BACL|nr:NADP-dependent oxidoreductase [Planococcus salinus]RNF38931.1 NADP-dependent oxidoreductase [Planococcus salinus]
MTQTKQQEIHLVNRPTGTPAIEDFKFVECDVPSPKENEVLVRALYISVDPYMRGRMNDTKSYIPPFELNKAIVGGVIAEVAVSRSESFKRGDLVLGNLNWAEYSVAKETKLRKIDPNLAPLTAYLSVLGMTGLTAYFGLLDIGKPQEGETVVVSGAAGAVGSAVGQIAKLKGAKVVGIAGTDEKLAYIKNELGFDETVNYKSENFKEELKAATPDGVDVYFDNVGGDVSDAVMRLLNNHARIPVCGSISSYNAEGQDVGPRVQPTLIKTSSLMKGFTVGNYASEFEQGRNDLANWLQEGKLKYKETIVEGFEKTPEAFLGLFKGINTGKLLVKAAEPEYSKNR